MLEQIRCCIIACMNPADFTRLRMASLKSLAAAQARSNFRYGPRPVDLCAYCSQPYAFLATIERLGCAWHLFLLASSSIANRDLRRRASKSFRSASLAPSALRVIGRNGVA
jgi:hypothetical protein